MSTLMGCATTNGGEAAPKPAAQARPAAVAPVGLEMFDADDTSVSLRPGQGFVVELPANRTTPFEWVLELAPDAPVTLTRQSYEQRPPPGCPEPCVGYGGTERFELRCKDAPGSAVLSFRYVSVVDKAAPPRRTHELSVSVAEK